MKQLIKNDNSYSLWIDGKKVFEQETNFLSDESPVFTPETLDLCFGIHCEQFGLNPDGTEG